VALRGAFTGRQNMHPNSGMRQTRLRLSWGRLQIVAPLLSAGPP
jgi:hypothetical protein